ncbi:Tastin [Pontoporia blainvillei]|uniref:Tastin n=1 Tax=Pontoporia blainvillei TaxID=48723 RepID=A0ABX0S7N6_PONBL|nr:Tastin [Pontoporia blainvillei]
MTTLQATKDPLLRGVSPTPSKIPVRSQRRPPLPTVKPSALDQENQDPRKLVQKLSSQRPLVDSASPRPKATHQTEQSERLVGTQLRNPLEELRPSPGRQNVGPRPPPQTALATILSGEGVKSCRLGRQPSLAQRVLVRGNQGGTIRRGQDARASAYLAPRTPTHRLDPARASCFSRLEGPGPRGRTLCPQRREALTSYSVLRRLAIRPKTQFTPLPSAPRAQQAQWLSGLSPQPCPEEPALPWEQIAVRLFDQESGIRLQEGPGKPPMSTPYGPHPSRTPHLQELKMQVGWCGQQL